MASVSNYVRYQPKKPKKCAAQLGLDGTAQLVQRVIALMLDDLQLTCGSRTPSRVLRDGSGIQWVRRSMRSCGLQIGCARAGCGPTTRRYAANWALATQKPRTLGHPFEPGP